MYGSDTPRSHVVLRGLLRQSMPGAKPQARFGDLVAAMTCRGVPKYSRRVNALGVAPLGLGVVPIQAVDEVCVSCDRLPKNNGYVENIVLASHPGYQERLTTLPLMSWNRLAKSAEKKGT